MPKHSGLKQPPFYLLTIVQYGLASSQRWLHSAGREAEVWTLLGAGTRGLTRSLHIVSGLLLYVASSLTFSTWLCQQSSQTSYMTAQDIQGAKIETSRPS